MIAGRKFFHMGSPNAMTITPAIMQILLFGCALSMNLLAAFYLRRRELSILAFTAWGLFALVFPVLGPFLVIWFQPGKPVCHNSPPNNKSGQRVR